MEVLQPVPHVVSQPQSIIKSSLTGGEKEGKCKLVASKKHHESLIFGMYNEEGIGMSRSLEYLGICLISNQTKKFKKKTRERKEEDMCAEHWQVPTKF